MAKQESEKKRIATWHKRVNDADKIYKRWSTKYMTELCEDFYYGHQVDESEEGHPQYTINMIFPTIEVKIPSMLFTHPGYRVTPRPQIIDDPMSTIVERCKLQEDTLNTIVVDDKVNFKEEIELAVKEAFWAFGIIEVGYTADYVDNPNARQPMLDEDNLAMLDEDGEPVLEPDILLESETAFVKRVPSKQFRVSVVQRNNTQWLDWCGYWEYHYISDIKRNKFYKNTGSLKLNTTNKLDASLAGEPEQDETPDENEERNQRAGMLKVWKIWDMRKKVKKVFADGMDKFFIENEPFSFLPFAPLRFHQRIDKWYPVPPIFNWLGPQMELNETREMLRVHRRRFLRRYLKDPSVEAKEMDKLQAGPDGAWIEAAAGTITPVPDAPLDSNVTRSIPLSKEDLREISGVTGEERGIAESETATQANIVNVRANIRENFGRKELSRWLAYVGKLLLLTMRENMALPVVVARNVDELSPSATQEKGVIQQLWQEIQTEELGEIVHDISVDPQDLSPLGEEQERNNFFQGLAVLGNPQFAPLLLGSPVLLRKALRFFRITNGRDIAEIEKALMLVTMATQAAQAGPSGPTAGGASNLPTAPPGGQPDNSQIAMQLAKQSSGGDVQ